VRLSTFSSQTVTVDWAVIAKANAFDDAEATLANGALTFLPGETLKTITAPVATPGNYDLIRVALQNPANAEVTGGAWYFKTPPGANPTLVPTGSSGWRYRETRSEPPAEWKQLAFDDTGAEWLPATLPAGFGATGVITTVTSGPDTDRTKAFYFRKKFTVASPAEIAALSFRIRRDDAAVVWLNNDPTPVVVSADGTFNGPYTYATTGVPNSTNTGTYLTYAIPPAKLVAGENILAIEVHQTTLTSSDLILDCELLATLPTPLELRLTTVGGTPLLYWFDGSAVLEETDDLALPWSTMPGATSPMPFTPVGTRGFFRLSR
jgi:hypothetical protein